MPTKLADIAGQLQEIFAGTCKHLYYDRCVKDAHQLAIHANGEKPIEMLKCRRPNETLEVQEYRLEIWEPITKEPISKVVSSCQKIRRSPDYSIKYPDQKEFSKIREGETLQDYCEYNYPFFKSVTNWFFAVYLRKYLIDANAVIVVAPDDFTDNPGEYRKPYPKIYDSCDVMEFVDEDYCVLKRKMGCEYIENGDRIKGDSFLVITTEYFARYDQTSAAGNYTLVPGTEIEHKLGVLPAFKVPALIQEICDGRSYNLSRIDGMLSHLNEAAREYSDIQAAKVNHLYPERWEFTQNDCKDCAGSGKRHNPLFTGPGCGCDPQIECNTCGGHGYKVVGPYGKLLVRPTNNAIEGNQPIPLPPAGYIEKDVEIIKLMDDSIEKHIDKALSAVNMEFLSKTPTVQSGLAKENDRDESKNTIHSIAEDLVAAEDRLYYLTAKWRYNALYDDEMIKKMCPQIPVPEKYDLITAAQSLAELKLAKDGKANPVIINAMEQDLVSKRFSTDPEVLNRLTLEMELDPFPNITEDEKNSRLANKGISKVDYVISSNIHEFVQIALSENPDFASLPDADKRAKMDQFAEELLTEMEESNPAMPPIIDDTPPEIVAAGVDPNADTSALPGTQTQPPINQPNSGITQPNAA